jgi:hypothetical protein
VLVFNGILLAFFLYRGYKVFASGIAFRASGQRGGLLAKLYRDSLILFLL